MITSLPPHFNQFDYNQYQQQQQQQQQDDLALMQPYLFSAGAQPALPFNLKETPRSHTPQQTQWMESEGPPSGYHNQRVHPPPIRLQSSSPLKRSRPSRAERVVSNPSGRMSQSTHRRNVSCPDYSQQPSQSQQMWQPASQAASDGALTPYSWPEQFDLNEVDDQTKLAWLQNLQDTAAATAAAQSPVPDLLASNRPSVSSIGHRSPATPNTDWTNGGGSSGGNMGHVQNLNGNGEDAFTSPMFWDAEDLYASYVDLAGFYPANQHQPKSNGMYDGPDPQLLSPYRQTFFDPSYTQSPASSPQTAHSPAHSSQTYSPAHSQSFSPMPFHTAAGMRRQQNAESSAREWQHHQPPTLNRVPTQTISPRDALLDQHEIEDGQMQLFPGEFADDMFSHLNVPDPAPVPAQAQPQAPFPLGEQYMSVDHARNTAPEAIPDFPTPLLRMETTASDDPPPASEASPAPASSPPVKPPHTQAETGTYTCTYRGCVQRFDSPAKLQSHKRDSHRTDRAERRATSPTHSEEEWSQGESTSTSAKDRERDTQAGPHKCTRTNPSTGKPCNTIFSRPYDLTRHEDTIHNARKQKVRCEFCTEEKTFSRHDALTRHMRVVHPDIETSRRRKH